MLFFSKISSALYDVGPLAPSTINFAEISGAFFSVIESSIAAGIKTSTFKERSSLFDILSPPLKFFNDPLFSFR